MCRHTFSPDISARPESPGSLQMLTSFLDEQLAGIPEQLLGPQLPYDFLPSTSGGSPGSAGETRLFWPMEADLSSPGSSMDALPFAADMTMATAESPRGRANRGGSVASFPPCNTAPDWMMGAAVAGQDMVPPPVRIPGCAARVALPPRVHSEPTKPQPTKPALPSSLAQAPEARTKVEPASPSRSHDSTHTGQEQPLSATTTTAAVPANPLYHLATSGRTVTSGYFGFAGNDSANTAAAATPAMPPAHIEICTAGAAASNSDACGLSPRFEDHDRRVTRASTRSHTSPQVSSPALLPAKRPLRAVADLYDDTGDSDHDGWSPACYSSKSSKKIGRPAALDGDLEDPNLSTEERRRIRRRLMNRASAQRVRMKREVQVIELQAKVTELRAENSRLLAALRQAELARALAEDKQDMKLRGNTTMCTGR